MHVTYALSIHSFVSKIGAYLGFAALIGVALLVIMFFVQARETALLRDRAEDAEEDLERLRQYAEQVSRQAATAQQSAAQAAQAAQAAPRTAARPAAAGAGAASRVAAAPAVAAARSSRLPVAPVGVGAPALSSATRLIPLAEPAPGPSTPAAAANGQATSPPAFNARAATAPSMPAPAPAVAAPTGHGTTGAPTVAAPPPAATPTPAPALRASGSGPGSPADRAPRRDYGHPETGGPRVGRGSVLLAAVLVVVIIIAAVLVITHQSHHATTSRTAAATTSHSSSKTSTAKGKATTVHVNPTSVRVAVLNGTNTTNLAADVSAKLNKVGFQQGATGNYDDSTQSSTTVGYLPGNQAKGMAVAKALGLNASSVHQINSQAEQLVCPSGPSQCADQVVVTVGSNLNSDAS